MQCIFLPTCSKSLCWGSMVEASEGDTRNSLASKSSTPPIKQPKRGGTAAAPSEAAPERLRRSSTSHRVRGTTETRSPAAGLRGRGGAEGSGRDGHYNLAD